MKAEIGFVHLARASGCVVFTGTPPSRFRPIATEWLTGRRLVNAIEELGWDRPWN